MKVFQQLPCLELELLELLVIESIYPRHDGIEKTHPCRFRFPLNFLFQQGQDEFIIVFVFPFLWFSFLLLTSGSSLSHSNCFLRDNYSIIIAPNVSVIHCSLQNVPFFWVTFFITQLGQVSF
ncbi:hypothetical protein ACOMHN_030126 [Nucella lapillus]